MKIPARWLVLALFALVLVWIFSCSDDDCPTCPKPQVCDYPAKAFLGTWIVFESYTNGSPSITSFWNK